jgi:glycosyltransferase involved in cell wall biosynthesis
MRVANIMLGRGKGGLEQCVVDYAEALSDGRTAVHSIVDPATPLMAALKQAPGKISTLANRGQWDVFAMFRLRRLLSEIRPDAVVCHGNRAFRLASMAYRQAPLVFVAHNGRMKSAGKADAVFATGAGLLREAEALGFVEGKNAFIVPNMVRLPMQKPAAQRFRDPVAIGFLGRLSRCKGAHVLLEAAADLKNREGVREFEILIGGDGEERKSLERQAHKLEIDRNVRFLGWVDEKEAFFRKLDIFCLPSLSEAFGIAMLEAMGAGVPVVATDCQGPSEILEHGKTGVLAPRNAPSLLADALLSVMEKEKEAAATAAEAFKKAGEYSVSNAAHIMSGALASIVEERRAKRRGKRAA